MNKIEYLEYLKQKQIKKVNNELEDKRQKKASRMNIKRLQKAIDNLKNKEERTNKKFAR